VVGRKTCSCDAIKLGHSEFIFEEHVSSRLEGARRKNSTLDKERDVETAVLGRMTLVLLFETRIEIGRIDMVRCLGYDFDVGRRIAIFASFGFGTTVMLREATSRSW
jgi:hypothetical protein